MKLYLSSYKFGRHPEKLKELLGSRRHAGLILNASDLFGDARRPHYVAEFSEGLAALGITSEEIDLRHFFGDPDRLRSRLERCGMLWVSGGNTFTLRRAMRASGADLLIPELVRADQLVYGGFSAGACVASPTLHGIHLADEPDKVAANVDPAVIWEGLGLVDFFIAPHFRSPHPESPLMEAVVADYEKRHVPYYALVDGEAIVVDGVTVCRL